ncbi:MAG: hypothetical protein Q7K43_06550 [Candidatus Woesearchaeota archaeon]|nr:hypothetical protein [Candidatus Woesearchaeota archaeon]
MKRGRKPGSVIRQNIIELLFVLKRAYGYEIHKKYIKTFSACSRELIYYHLRKGVQLGEFILLEQKVEQGNYSWGTSVEKTYYSLGPNALPKGEPSVTEALST